MQSKLWKWKDTTVLLWAGQAGRPLCRGAGLYLSAEKNEVRPEMLAVTMTDEMLLPKT